MATRADATFVATPAGVGQEVAMIETFAELAASKDVKQWSEYAEASLKTQQYVDAIWRAASE